MSLLRGGASSIPGLRSFSPAFVISGAPRLHSRECSPATTCENGSERASWGQIQCGQQTAWTSGAPKCRTRHLGKVTSISPSCGTWLAGDSFATSWVGAAANQNGGACRCVTRQPEKGLVLAWAVLSRWSGGVSIAAQPPPPEAVRRPIEGLAEASVSGMRR